VSTHSSWTTETWKEEDMDNDVVRPEPSAALRDWTRDVERKLDYAYQAADYVTNTLRALRHVHDRGELTTPEDYYRHCDDYKRYLFDLMQAVAMIFAYEPPDWCAVAPPLPPLTPEEMLEIPF
jgi:hypothetical protein